MARGTAMNSSNRLWRGLGIVFVLSFAALGWLGREIYLAAPPIPTEIRSVSGAALFTHDQIVLGQQAWFKAGGQQLGTVWGHGSYVAPDWSADWLHREAIALRDAMSADTYGLAYAQLDLAQRAAIDARLKADMRRNTYDRATGILTVSNQRAAAIETVAAHYQTLFGGDASLRELRTQYAMPDDALPAGADRRAIAAFFFWSGWSATTDRPDGTGISYTSNWPHEPLVGNSMTDGSAIWSAVSVILLIGGVAAMVWWHSAHPEGEIPSPPAADPLLNAVATPSMKATRKYFFVVIALILVQIAMGAITAHY